MSSLPKCYFNYATLIATVGNSYKGYDELSCIQIPPFTKQELERESLGNGWYGSKVLITKVYDRYYVIIKDTKIYGILMYPYHQDLKIKSDIYPINYKYFLPEIKHFINDFKN